MRPEDIPESWVVAAIKGMNPEGTLNDYLRTMLAAVIAQQHSEGYRLVRGDEGRMA